MKRRWVAIAFAGGLVSACAGYNVQFGTSGGDLSQFHALYSIPATSLRPWAERGGTLPVPPVPDDGSSGTSTLPAAYSALPPERPTAASPSKSGN